MKTLGIFGLLLLGAFAGAAAADPITVAWDANPASEQVLGYVLYIGSDSQDYSRVIDVGNTLTYVFEAEPGQRYYFAVTAYRAGQLYSPLSNEVAGFTTPPTVSLTPDPAAPGNTLTADVTFAPGFTTDWVGLYQEGASDTSYIGWCYLNGAKTVPETVVTDASLPCFTAATGGRYEVRLFTHNTYTKVATSSTITVSGPSVALTPSSTTAGSALTAAVTDGPGNPTDWVALYREGAADTAFIAWCYLDGTRIKPLSGMTSASVPCFRVESEGRYQVRLFENNGFTRVATSNIITVAAPAPLPGAAVALTPDPATTGSTLTAAVTNGPGLPTDWAGLYLEGSSDTAFLAWCYLNGTRTVPESGLTAASVQCFTPTSPGRYQVRLFTNNTFTKVATSNTITVSAPAPPPGPSVTLTPDPAAVGTALTATLGSASTGAKDWMGLFAEGAGDTAYIEWCYLNGMKIAPASPVGSGPVSCFTSSFPGRYEVRLFSNNTFTKISTSNTITVPGPSVVLTPDPATAGAAVTATVSDPLATSTDWIGLYREGESDIAFVGWCYLNGAMTAPGTPITSAALTCVAPPTSGRYQVRLFSNNGFAILATSNTIDVP